MSPRISRRAAQMAPRYISMIEAAEWLGVSVDTVRRRISGGHITGYRMPGSRLVFLKIADEERLIESGEIPTTHRAS